MSTMPMDDRSALISGVVKAMVDREDSSAWKGGEFHPVMIDSGPGFTGRAAEDRPGADGIS